MKAIGIKELQVNPSVLTKALETEDYTMILKRNKPIGLAISIDDIVVSDGLKTALLIDGYKNGFLSLGQISKDLNKTKEETMKLLSVLGVNVIDYDFKDDLRFLDSF